MKIQYPRIAVLAPQGWSLRNWVLSDFLPTLTTAAEAIIFSPQAKKLREDFNIPKVSFEWMEVQPLGRVRQNVTATLDFAHYYRQQTYIHRSKLSRSTAVWPWWARLRTTMLKAVGRHLLMRFSDQWLGQTERVLLGLRVESKRIEEVFRAYDVALVFSTVPLIAHYERPALWAAQRLGIPTACFITSWDNLFSKGRLPINFDHYMVWSRQMADDLRAYYPKISASAISVVGAPQFDFYHRQDLLRDREDFIRSVGGDPSRKLILWTGASANLTPNEPGILELFCQAARSGRLRGQPQILVRPHPIGGGARFAEVRSRYPEMLFTETNSSDPTYLLKWTPMLEDMKLLVNSIAHCDVNINPSSTITLDCCVLDRPVINLAFDLESGSEMEQQMRHWFHYEHYRPVTELGAVRVAYSLEELITHVNMYLENPALDREGRASLLQLQCGKVDGKAAQRAAECLLRLLDASGQQSLTSSQQSLTSGEA